MFCLTPIVAAPTAPGFGPNVVIFNKSMPAADIQGQIDKVYATLRNNQFGPERNALLLAPGSYKSISR